MKQVKKTLVFVEDNDDHAEIFISMLRLGGVDNPVVRFDKGDGVVDYLISNWAGRNDEVVLVLDLKVPGVDGVGILRKLRGMDGVKDLPVVVLSSADRGEELDEVNRLGVEAALSKTGDMDAFVARIAKILGYSDGNDA